MRNLHVIRRPRQGQLKCFVDFEEDSGATAAIRNKGGDLLHNRYTVSRAPQLDTRLLFTISCILLSDRDEGMK